MTLSSFGYASLRSDRIDDWAEYGAKFLGLQVVERTKSALKFRMDDRKQRIVISSEGAGEARSAGRSRMRPRSMRWPAGSRRPRSPSRACLPPWPALRGVREAIRFQDPGRQRAGGLPRAEKRRGAFCAGPADFGLPHRHARHGPCRAACEERRGLALVLPGCAGLPAQRLHPPPVQGVLLPSQSAPPQPGHDRDRQERHPSHHDGALQPRRCRPGLRPGQYDPGSASA